MKDEEDVMDAAWEREQREAMKIEAENGLGTAWQEHIAGDPGWGYRTAEEQEEAANRFFASARRDLDAASYAQQAGRAMRELSVGPNDVQEASFGALKLDIER